MSGNSVVVGWLDPGTVAGDFAYSVARLAAYELGQQRLVTVLRVRSGPMLEEGRNKLVAQFLTTPGEWLLMVDSDMVFPHDAAEHLLQHADKHTSPVVGGLCFGVNDELGQFPTVYLRVDGLPQAQLVLPDSDVVEVDGTGAAFTLTHRTVFEKHRRDGHHPWFHRRTIPATDTHGGGVLGEDLSWCWHLRDEGVPIRVALDTPIGHVKPTIVGAGSYGR